MVNPLRVVKILSPRKLQFFEKRLMEKTIIEIQSMGILIWNVKLLLKTFLEIFF